MKRMQVITLVCLLLNAPCFAAEEKAAPEKPEIYTVVKCLDHTRKMSCRLVTQSELKELHKEIAAEDRLWDKAMKLCEKAWNNDPATEKKPFPHGAISPVKVIVAETFSVREKAQVFVDELEKKLQEKLEEEKKHREEKYKPPKNAAGNRVTGIKIDHKYYEHRRKMDEEHDELIGKAVSLLESKLAEAGGDKDPSAPVPAVPDPVKKGR